MPWTAWSAWSTAWNIATTTRFPCGHRAYIAKCRGRLAHGLARSAYGAFLVQGPVLVALVLALRPVPPAHGSQGPERRPGRDRRLVHDGVASGHPHPCAKDLVSPSAMRGSDLRPTVRGRRGA